MGIHKSCWKTVEQFEDCWGRFLFKREAASRLFRKLPACHIVRFPGCKQPHGDLGQRASMGLHVSIVPAAWPALHRPPTCCPVSPVVCYWRDVVVMSFALWWEQWSTQVKQGMRWECLSYMLCAGKQLHRDESSVQGLFLPFSSSVNAEQHLVLPLLERRVCPSQCEQRKN